MQIRLFCYTLFPSIEVCVFVSFTIDALRSAVEANQLMPRTYFPGQACLNVAHLPWHYPRFDDVNIHEENWL